MNELKFSEFSIDPFHFFDKKNLHEGVKESFIFDWKSALVEYKKQFPEHFFIVVENEKALFIETTLLSFIKTSVHNKKLYLSIDSDIKEEAIRIYLLQMHNQIPQHIEIMTTGAYPVTIFHDNIVCEQSQSQVYLTNQAPGSYYNSVTHKSSQIFYQQFDFKIQNNFNSFFMEKNQTGKTKIEYMANLYREVIFTHSSLNYLQNAQVRDETIEVIHCEKNAHSASHYLALKHGRAVSQVNSIINETAYESETHQHIKHILLAENAQSFSRPNLMIKNPQVVASHGNSIGSFPEDILFYLMQRGISELETQALIVQSMIRDFCDTTDYAEQLATYFGVSNEHH